MVRELKIVLTIFLVFFLFGLTSLFNTGSFITPYFLNKFILVIISIIFLLLNIKEKKVYLLFLFSLAFIAYAFLDLFVVIYITEKLKNNFLFDLYQMDLFRVSCMLVLFTPFFIFIYQMYKETEAKLVSFLFILLLISVILSLGMESGYVPTILMSVFAIGFFSFIQYSTKKISKILDVISIQFLLLFLLSVFEYFI